MKIAIPFQGFYESLISAYIDHEIEYLLEDDDGFTEDSVDYKATFIEVAKDYALQWCYLGGYEGVFSELYSPREYNFSTDLIFVEFTTKDLERIKTLAMAEEGFSDFVKEKCSHRDGFISFLSPNLADWHNWDKGHYEVALMFLETVYSYEDDIFEILGGNGGFSPILFEEAS